MNNFDKLCKLGKSCSILADTVATLKNSNGFYSMLFDEIMEMTDEELNAFAIVLNMQEFNDKTDVILFLEA